MACLGYGILIIVNDVLSAVCSDATGFRNGKNSTSVSSHRSRTNRDDGSGIMRYFSNTLLSFVKGRNWHGCNNARPHQEIA